MASQRLSPSLDLFLFMFLFQYHFSSCQHRSISSQELRPLRQHKAACDWLLKHE